jgi:crotonobetainyl-CoA:carnitine CoA-transferase CaiB-like acyl-CoA transferase
MPKPLSHFRIVDLSCVLAGPFATQLLADLGAEVQKLEPPGGDPTRGWGPPFEDGEEGESAYFRCANRGKRSRSIDLHAEEGKTDLFELLKDADVLVENFRADSADRLGLGWKRLHAKFPKLILASVRGFASDVIASRRAGYDFIIQAESGWMAITGEPDGQPMKVGVALVDVLAGLYCANGIQAALLHRERTGEALHIEVPLMETALASLVNVAADSLMTGQPPKRWGNAHPQIVPYQSFRCSDGDVAIGVGSDRQFEVLAMWLGLDLEARPEWKKNHGRVKDREELVPLIEARTQASTLDEVLAFCDSNAIPASRVRSVDEVLFRQGGTLHNLLQPLFDAETNTMVPTLATPLLLNGERACASLPPPRWQP